MKDRENERISRFLIAKEEELIKSRHDAEAYRNAYLDIREENRKLRAKSNSLELFIRDLRRKNERFLIENSEMQNKLSEFTKNDWATKLLHFKE
jgi:hypothetical protein